MTRQTERTVRQENRQRDMERDGCWRGEIGRSRERERDDETDIKDCQTGRQTGIETGAEERANKHPGVGVHGHRGCSLRYLGTPLKMPRCPKI
jgi:hypothetical protein